MALTTFLWLLVLLASLTLGHSHQPWTKRTEWRRAGTRAVPQLGFFDPNTSGGSLLTQMNDMGGLGEPLNAIISGYSNQEVLVDAELKGGLRNYFLSLGFSSECLGQIGPGQQGANLGDGSGWVNQTAIIRWNYGDPNLGTCKETIQGGNHFRYWIQDGPDGNSGAVFMATSYEKPLSEYHDIIPNGYNLGRDWLVGNITKSPIPTQNLTNASTFSGSTEANGYTYETAIQYMGGLLQNTSLGVNHNDTVPVNGSNAIDGLVAVMTVKITGRPEQNGSLPSSVSATQLTSTFFSAVFLSSMLLFAP